MGTMYTGTFPRALKSDTEDTAFGIVALRTRFDPFGAEELRTTVADRPGWVTLHPTAPALYAVHEVRRGPEEAGAVVSHHRDDTTGRLVETARRATAASPCHAAVCAGGRMLVVPTFHGGTVHTFALDAHGTLGAETSRTAHGGSGTHAVRQRTPHPHAAIVDPFDRWVLVPDFGTDRVEVYAIDAETPRLVHHPELGAALEAGSGARHGVFHPGGRWLFVISEMTAAVTMFAFDPHTGALTAITSHPILPPGQPGLRSGAEVVIDRDGRFLYATNRAHGSSGPAPEGGEDCVAWFAVDAASGALTPRGRIASGGSIPRTCALSDDGRSLLVAHQGSSNVTRFAVGADGALTATGETIRTPVPVSLALVPPSTTAD